MNGSRSILLNGGEELIKLDDVVSAQLKNKLLEICDDIFSYCEENSLCCMLGGGSALGAVRHKGFIPWDDDMDLNMPREDYDRFALGFEKAMGDKYTLFVPDGKHKATNLFMKVSLNGTVLEDIYSFGSGIKTGITVDIFPIENVPENNLKRKIKAVSSDIFAYSAVSAYMFQCKNNVMKDVYSKSKASRINYKFRMLVGALLSFRNYQKWYACFDSFSKASKSGALCTIPTGRKHYSGEMVNKMVFYPTKKMRFENKEYFVPNEVDTYLYNLYGDYMQLPPESQRERHAYISLDF